MKFCAANKYSPARVSRFCAFARLGGRRGRGLPRSGAICLLLGALALLTAGCPVTQRLDTPASPEFLTEPQTGARYWLYVPSNYTDQKTWPMVVTLHGTYGWDGPMRQEMEWRNLAEENGFIVAAPYLYSVQGILPTVKALWYRDLEKDERNILSLIDHLSRKYRIDAEAIMLTGFSAGGYPLYYTGLRNPERFNLLIARACNCDIKILEKIPITPKMQEQNVVIFWGKADPLPIKNQSWAAFRYLRRHGCRNVQRKKIEGGHFRKPGIAMRIWRKYLPDRYTDADR